MNAKISPGTPKNPTNKQLKTLNPMFNPKAPPTVFNKNKINPPINAFTTNFIINFIGSAISFKIRYKIRIAMKNAINSIF